MKIVIFGHGVVGNATGLVLERAGFTPQFWDIIEDRRTCTWGDVIGAEITFLCLSTMKSVREDSAIIEREVQRLDESNYQGAYVQRTTCVPGTAEKVCSTFGLARRYCVFPEFLREAHWQEDALKPDRVVTGIPKQWPDTLEPSPVVQFLRELAAKVFPPDTPVFSLTLHQAELSKLIANAFLAMRISAWNELAERWPADMTDALIESVVADSRLKSFDVFFGRSWGGKCFSKDLPCLGELIPNGVVAGTVTVNRRMQEKEGTDKNATAERG